VFDKEFSFKETLTFGKELGVPHQALWWGGVLYVTDTDHEKDRVLLWDGEDIQTIRWPQWEEHVIHPNSIWCDGEAFYVVEHGGSGFPKWVQVLDLEFNPLERIELPKSIFPEPSRIFHGIHNIYVEEGILYTLGPTSVVWYEIASGESDHVFFTQYMDGPFYNRGLARVKGKFYIGLSEIRERRKRAQGNSFILVADDNFNVLNILKLELAGGLHEIRAIDSLDLAHNRVKCPLLKGEKYGKNVNCNTIEERSTQD
jgi:hypothetical protein